MIAHERLHSPRMARPIPRLEGGLPVLGHAAAFQSAPLTLLERGHRRYGAVFAFRMAGRDVVLYAGPEAHAAWFAEHDDDATPTERYRFHVPTFGASLACDASPLAGHASPLADALLDDHAERMHDEIAQHLESWGDAGEVELPVVLEELTLHIAARCLLGDALRAQADGDFARLYRELRGGLPAIGFFAPRLPTPAHLRRDRARRELGRLIGDLVEARRGSAAPASDGLQRLIEARDADGRPASAAAITDAVLGALFGGPHAAAVLATWVGAELLQHPPYIAPILDELRQVYGDGAALDAHSLERQTRLDNAVRECERMHPPLVILARRLTRDLEACGHIAPAGSVAMLSPALSHRLPAVFKDPHRFDPDRFESQRAGALLGFGARRGAGVGFVYQQIKAIWSVLLSRFEMELATFPPSPDYTCRSTAPHQPCRVRYRRRETPSAEVL